MPDPRMTPDAAEHYVAMMGFAACAMHYVTAPGRWAAYIAFLEQTSPDLPPGTSSEQVRLIMAADADEFTQMAMLAREKLAP